MAQAIRIAPGVYTVNGKRVNAPDSQTAIKMVTGGAGPKPTYSSTPGMPVAPGNLRGDKRNEFYRNQQAGQPQTGQTQVGTGEVVAGENRVADAALDAATSSLQDPNNQVGTAFNPTLTARVSEGDMLANRQKVEDAAYARMTADYAKNKEFDSQALEQRLYKRGIPFDPRDAQRTRWTGALDKRYDDLQRKARQDAITQADAANQAQIATNEGMRTNDLNSQLAINQQQGANFAGLAGVGGQLASGVASDAATRAAMDALKKKTPAELALLKAQTGAANRSNVGSNASQTQSAFG